MSSRPISRRAASECLSDPDIQFESVAARLPVQWYCDIETNRADRGVISGADARADPPAAGERRAVRGDLAGIHERHHAVLVQDPLAKLDRSRAHRRAAGRLPVRELRPDRLVTE